MSIGTVVPMECCGNQRRSLPFNGLECRKVDTKGERDNHTRVKVPTSHDRTKSRFVCLGGSGNHETAVSHEQHQTLNPESRSAHRQTPQTPP